MSASDHQDMDANLDKSEEANCTAQLPPPPATKIYQNQAVLSHKKKSCCVDNHRINNLSAAQHVDRRGQCSRGSSRSESVDQYLIFVNEATCNGAAGLTTVQPVTLPGAAAKHRLEKLESGQVNVYRKLVGVNAADPLDCPTFPDDENQTIRRVILQNQKIELQQLVTELKDRDKELNALMSAHQKQMIKNRHDQSRIRKLEESNRQLKKNLTEKDLQIHEMESSIKCMKEQSKKSTDSHVELQQELKKLRQIEDKSASHHQQNVFLDGELTRLSEKFDHISVEKDFLERKLDYTMKELESKSQIQNELTNRLKSSVNKLKNFEETQKQYEVKVANLEEELTLEKKKLMDMNQEIQTKQEMNESLSVKLDEMMVQLKFSADKEQRHKDLLHSQKLKQERTEMELKYLRKLYEQMQQNLLSLQFIPDSSRNATMERLQPDNKQGTFLLNLEDYEKSEDEITVKQKKSIDLADQESCSNTSFNSNVNLCQYFKFPDPRLQSKTEINEENKNQINAKIPQNCSLENRELNQIQTSTETSFVEAYNSQSNYIDPYFQSTQVTDITNITEKDLSFQPNLPQAQHSNFCDPTACSSLLFMN